MRLLRMLAAAIVVLLALAIPLSVRADTAPLILVLTPGLKLEDLGSYYNLSRLAEQGCRALMNCNSAAGLRSLSGSYLTIGSGQRAAGLSGLIILQEREHWKEEAAPSLYRRLIGQSAGPNAIMIPNFNLVLNHNENSGNGAKPGSLGQALREGGISVFLLGNHDLPENTNRPAALLAADRQGLIPYGRVDEGVNLADPLAPDYFSANYPFLAQAITACLQEGKGGLIVVDLADLARLDTMKASLSPAVYEQNRDRILQEMDNFLGYLSHNLQQSQATLLLVTPYPSKDDVELGNSLTPVILFRPGQAPGLLASASTKRAGLITNLDLAPTILEHFSLPVPGFFLGQAISPIPSSGSLAILEEKLAAFKANHQQRPVLLKGYVLLEIIMISTVIVLLLLQYKLPVFFCPAILTLTSGPLLFLLLPLFPTNNVFSRIAILLPGALGATALLQCCPSPIFRLTLLCLITTGAIVVDILRGAPLMLGSLLGYDPMGGSRFYGLGNEYMGVLLGSSIMGYTLLLEGTKSWKPKYFTALRLAFFPLAAALLCLTAAPQWGTNVGGGLAFFLAYALLGLLLSNYRITARSVLGLGGAASAALALLFAFDSLRPVELQSHIGLSARIIKEEGLGNLLPVMERKLAMNLKLIRNSIWSRAFLGFLLCSTLLHCRPLGLIKTVFSKYPYLAKGFTAGIAGTFMALLCNDSGIVAAATAMLLITPTLLYLIILENSR